MPPRAISPSSRADGSLASWGRDHVGQVSNTPTAAGFVAVAAGDSFSVAISAPIPVDTDGDGLLDPDETGVHGTNPNDPDTDDDGLWDATEVDTAQGGGCPDPTAADSDGDTLADGDEVALGTSPCDPDTDGDTVHDGIDPTPTEPGVTGGFLEEATRDLGARISATDLQHFNGPNANANEGRRNALANRAAAAANAIAAGNYGAARVELEALLERIDGLTPPPDWMDTSQAKSDLADEVVWLIFLLGY